MFSHRIEEAINHTIYKYGKDLKVISNKAPLISVTEGKHTRAQKLGKFLAPFYDEKFVKELVEEYKQLNSDISEYTVSFSTDYVEVYQEPLYAVGSTTKSCMTAMDCVEVYKEDSNLKLLLIHRKERLVGRTLVRDDRKEFIRLYIDHNQIKDFVANAILTKHGYELGNLEGIRLSKVECSEGYRMPFLDGDADHVTDMGSYFLVEGYGELSASETSGYLCIPTCSCCGRVTNEDELRYVELAGSEYCESCFDDKFIFYDGETYYLSDCVANESNGELVPESIARETLVLTAKGDWYDEDDAVYTVDEECYPSDDCQELVLEHNGSEYALKENAILVEGRDGFEDGYYLQEQIDEIEQEQIDESQLDIIALLNELNNGE